MFSVCPHADIALNPGRQVLVKIWEKEKPKGHKKKSENVHRVLGEMKSGNNI